MKQVSDTKAELNTAVRPLPSLARVPDRPVDLDAVEAIVRLGRAGTFGPAELWMRLRQVIA